MFGEKFIESITDLAKNEIITKDGIKFSTRKLFAIEKPKATALNGNTLDSVVNFIHATLDIEKVTYPLLVSVSHNRIKVHSQLDSNELSRDFLFEASPLLPELELGRWQNVESFIIKLQTCFEETDNRDALLSLVSNFVTKDTLEIKDNGVGQEVNITSGVSLEQTTEIQPIIALTPKRTFQGVDQVESLFLFRARKDTNVCLFEADGGAWKDTARSRIVAFLTEILETLVDENKVAII